VTVKNDNGVMRFFRNLGIVTAGVLGLATIVYSVSSWTWDLALSPVIEKIETLSESDSLLQETAVVNRDMILLLAEANRYNVEDQRRHNKIDEILQKHNMSVREMMKRRRSMR
jgi:hypothetical protein